MTAEPNLPILTSRPAPCRQSAATMQARALVEMAHPTAGPRRPRNAREQAEYARSGTIGGVAVDKSAPHSAPAKPLSWTALLKTS